MGQFVQMFRDLIGRSPWWFKVPFFGILTLVVVGVIADPIVAYATRSEVVATVTDKERVCDGGGENGAMRCRYLVFTDVTTYENTDTLWYLKFDSSDIQGRIAVGGRYRFTVYRWRVPWLSWYPNIIAAERVS